MRIAFVTPDYPPDLGGIQVVLGELASHMVRAGHEVEVLAHATPLAPAGCAHQDGVLVRRFRVPVPSQEFAVSPALLAELVRSRRRFDIVHAHSFHALPALGAALARMRPLVFTPYYHGGGHTRAAKLAHIVYRPVSRLLFRACTHIVCVSVAEADALTAGVRGITAPVTVIRSGVNESPFSEAEPFELEANIVVAAGRIEPYKQFDRVALAAELLAEEHETVLLGDGSARASIEELLARRGLSARVRLLGKVSDEELRRWFRTAKALVSMSRHESFGLTLVEALAAGTPVVASDIPAHREIADGQPTGAVRLVSPDAQPREVAAEISRAIRDGLPAGVHVSSWADATSQMLLLYESILSARAA